MLTKTFEVRDRGTFIPVLATQLLPNCEADRYLLGRAGFGPDAATQAEYVLLAKIAGGVGQATSDPYEWPASARTMQVAHDHIRKHFASLLSGAVIDVEFILGESAQPKESEALNPFTL